MSDETSPKSRVSKWAPVQTSITPAPGAAVSETFAQPRGGGHSKNSPSISATGDYIAPQRDPSPTSARSQHLQKYEELHTFLKHSSKLSSYIYILAQSPFNTVDSLASASVVDIQAACGIIQIPEHRHLLQTMIECLQTLGLVNYRSPTEGQHAFKALLSATLASPNQKAHHVMPAATVVDSASSYASSSSNNNDDEDALSNNSTPQQVGAWILSHGFPVAVTQSLIDYTGRDILAMTREDCKDVIGVIEGIRLYNRIRSSGEDTAQRSTTTSAQVVTSVFGGSSGSTTAAASSAATVAPSSAAATSTPAKTQPVAAAAAARPAVTATATESKSRAGTPPAAGGNTMSMANRAMFENPPAQSTSASSAASKPTVGKLGKPASPQATNQTQSAVVTPAASTPASATTSTPQHPLPALPIAMPTVATTSQGTLPGTGAVPKFQSKFASPTASTAATASPQITLTSTAAATPITTAPASSNNSNDLQPAWMQANANATPVSGVQKKPVPAGLLAASTFGKGQHGTLKKPTSTVDLNAPAQYGRDQASPLAQMQAQQAQQQAQPQQQPQPAAQASVVPAATATAPSSAAAPVQPVVTPAAVVAPATTFAAAPSTSSTAAPFKPAFVNKFAPAPGATTTPFVNKFAPATTTFGAQAAGTGTAAPFVSKFTPLPATTGAAPTSVAAVNPFADKFKPNAIVTTPQIISAAPVQIASTNSGHSSPTAASSAAARSGIMINPFGGAVNPMAKPAPLTKMSADELLISAGGMFNRYEQHAPKHTQCCVWYSRELPIDRHTGRPLSLETQSNGQPIRFLGCVWYLDGTTSVKDTKSPQAQYIRVDQLSDIFVGISASLWHSNHLPPNDECCFSLVSNDGDDVLNLEVSESNRMDEVYGWLRGLQGVLEESGSSVMLADEELAATESAGASAAAITAQKQLSASAAQVASAKQQQHQTQQQSPHTAALPSMPARRHSASRLTISGPPQPVTRGVPAFTPTLPSLPSASPTQKPQPTPGAGAKPAAAAGGPVVYPSKQGIVHRWADNGRDWLRVRLSVPSMADTHNMTLTDTATEASQLIVLTGAILTVIRSDAQFDNRQWLFGVMPLNNAAAAAAAPNASAASRTIVLQADSEQERQEWLRTIDKHIRAPAAGTAAAAAAKPAATAALPTSKPNAAAAATNPFDSRPSNANASASNSPVATPRGTSQQQHSPSVSTQMASARIGGPPATSLFVLSNDGRHCKQGALNKLGGSIKTWRRRMFGLLTSGVMEYFDLPQSGNDQVIGKMQGSILCLGCTVYAQITAQQVSAMYVTGHNQENMFGLSERGGNGRVYIFEAPSQDEKQAWLTLLSDCSQPDVKQRLQAASKLALQAQNGAGGGATSDSTTTSPSSANTQSSFPSSASAVGTSAPGASGGSFSSSNAGSFPGSLFEGVLDKQSGNAFTKAWQERYCVLTATQLRYYKPGEARTAQGMIDLSQGCGVVLELSAAFNRDHVISLAPLAVQTKQQAGRKFVFAAESSHQAQAWKAAIDRVTTRLREISSAQH